MWQAYFWNMRRLIFSVEKERKKNVHIKFCKIVIAVRSFFLCILHNKKFYCFARRHKTRGLLLISSYYQSTQHFHMLSFCFRCLIIKFLTHTVSVIVCKHFAKSLFFIFFWKLLLLICFFIERTNWFLNCFFFVL